MSLPPLRLPHAIATGFCAIGVTALLFAQSPTQTRAEADRLVVHEWGTFTSMQGSDGVILEGLQREEEALPDFVYSRTKVRECPLRQYGYKGLEVPATHVTQKMETPVLYFHTRTPRSVRVRVDFVGGLLTQWFPVSDLVGPPEAGRAGESLDLTKVDRSFLEWDVDLIPRGGRLPAEIPAVSPEDPWSFAREVDSALVRTVPRRKPERLGPTEAEHYLFYRGLGAFSLPIEVESRSGGRLVIRNRGPHALPALFAMEMGPETGCFEALPALAAGAETTVDLSSTPRREKAAIVEGLRRAVAATLVDQGLFRDEARAMVRTWSRSWFGSSGTRLLYVVPRVVTDALLPLRISPEPDAIVRVLVGRLECLSPEVESHVETALRDRLSNEASVRDEAMATLGSHGRFLEPILRRVIAKTHDETVRKSGESVLATLR